MNGVFNVFSPQQNNELISINDKLNFNLNLISPLLFSNEVKKINSNTINKFPIFNFYDVNYFNSLFQNYKYFLFNNQNKNSFILNNNKDLNENRKNNYFQIGKKKKRNEKLCTNCPHTYSPHYAKGMCSNCYHSKGRSKKPWKCSHINKSHYALGLCQNCYQIAYIKKQNLENKKDKIIGNNINIVNNNNLVFDKKVNDDNIISKDKSIDNDRTLSES